MNIDFGTDTSRIPRDDPTHALFPIYATMTKSILTFPPNFQRNFYSFYVLSNSTRSKTSDTRVSDTLHRNSITISKHVHISSFYIFSRLISPSLSPSPSTIVNPYPRMNYENYRAARPVWPSIPTLCLGSKETRAADFRKKESATHWLASYGAHRSPVEHLLRAPRKLHSAAFLLHFRTRCSSDKERIREADAGEESVREVNQI